jgi:hypothetical protein
LVTRLLWPTILWLVARMALAKNIHGTRPAKTKRA